MPEKNVFVTGATGYIGRHLIPELLRRGHSVRALVRPGSESRLVPGAEAIAGDPLDSRTFAAAILPGSTFVQLVGVPHPSPSKAALFREIDLVSVRESAAAARERHAGHFIYLSVAQPAPVMRAYVEVRAEGERLVRAAGLRATFVRPWYVLGPGHRWPYLILPLYWAWMLSPRTRETASRLYPTRLRDLVRSIAESVEVPPADVRIVDAQQMRNRNASPGLAATMIAGV